MGVDGVGAENNLLVGTQVQITKLSLNLIRRTRNFLNKLLIWSENVKHFVRKSGKIWKLKENYFYNRKHEHEFGKCLHLTW